VLGAVLIAFVVPMGILAHELGHGLAALWLTNGPVRVLVGRQPGLLRLRLGRLGLQLHVEAARGVGWRGLCIYQRTGVPRDDLWILAAGPMTSLLWAVLCTAGLAVWGAQIGRLGQVACGLGVLEGVIAFVYNGAAAVIPDLCTARPRSDGAKIQCALRARRGLREIEAKVGRPMTKGELRQMSLTRKIPADALRERTSIPPPSRVAPEEEPR
jgi:hypothetical protein